MIKLSSRPSKKQTNASASVVDGKLILSLPDAMTPVVWQMDLNQAKASALEVTHDEDKHDYTLGLKTPRGETTDIARFSERAAAVEGLMSAAEALQNAHGQIRPASAAANDGSDQVQGQNQAAPPQPNASVQKTGGRAGKWVIGVLAIALVLILMNIWSMQMPIQVTTGAGEAGGSAAGASYSDPQDTNGVPLSANDVLQGR